MPQPGTRQTGKNVQILRNFNKFKKSKLNSHENFGYGIFFNY